MEVVHMDAALEAGDERLHGLGGVLEEILAATLERAWAHPADPRAQIRVHTRQVFRSDDYVAAAHVEVVFENHRDALRAEGFLERAVICPNLLHGAFHAAGQNDHFLSDPHDAAGDLAAKPA